MFIAIEGLDGSGKSTLVDGLGTHLERKGISISRFQPTRPRNPTEPVERLYRHFHLDAFWFSRAFLFAYRSRQAFLETDWQAPVVLGDRSIVTSYVVYRHRFGNRRITEKWVDLLEPHIPSPDIVLYLEVDPHTLEERKTKRGIPRNIDEEGGRPAQMAKAYDEIRTGRWRIRRLARSRWFRIDASPSKEEVLAQALHVIGSVRLERRENFDDPNLIGYNSRDSFGHTRERKGECLPIATRGAAYDDLCIPREIRRDGKEVEDIREGTPKDPGGEGDRLS
ncbi:MAG: hypothetical protein D6812_17875 [Deltaproteobacteria bacterium]|nr:MAG: hypothetical protein D6812_17875 [Deltaproteobacteria bacterium]